MLDYTKNKGNRGLLLWHSYLRIRRCHYIGLGHCCGSSSLTWEFLHATSVAKKKKKKEGGTKGTRSLENIGLGLRRWKCPRWTLDCAWGVSESQRSYTVFSRGMGCPGELINQKNGAVTRRQV